MAQDTDKLRALVDEQRGGEGNADQNPDDELEGAPDPGEDASGEAQDARKMNPAVGYMELSEPAGAFSCGTCTFGTPSDEEGVGTCINELVRAQVSTTNGCCNLFVPAEAEVVFPPGSGEEGDEEEGEEEEEEIEEGEAQDEFEADEEADEE